MKYELHVPTEQYGFISVVLESIPGYKGIDWEIPSYEPTVEEAIIKYHEIKKAWDGGEGLAAKPFAEMLYEYATTGSVVNGGDVYGGLSKDQQLLVHQLKKIIKTKNK